MRFWILPDSGPNTTADLETFLAPFRAEHKDIDVKVEIFNRDSLWKRLFRLSFDDEVLDAPDVVQIPHAWTPLFIKSNLIENLTLLDPALALTNYLAPLITHCYKPGTKDIYSIPWWMDISALHYRVDHLERVSKNPAEDLSTWEGFLKICDALKHEFKDVSKYYPVQNSDWRGSLSVRNALPCIWSRGIDLTDKDFSRSLFTEDAFVDALEDYLQLALKKYMPILTERGSVGTMASGRASMILTRRQGQSIFENEDSNDFKVKTLPVPATGGSSAAFISGINLAITKKSVFKEDALAFIKWLGRGETQLKYASLMEVFPALEEKFDDFIFSSPMRMQTYTKIIAQGRTLGAHMVLPTATKILNEVLDKMAENILHGTYSRASLKDNLAYAAKEVDYLLNLYE